MIKGAITYIANPVARARAEFAAENEKLRARIAELEKRLDYFEEMHELVFRASHLIDAAKKCGLQARAKLKGEKSSIPEKKDE
jgi:cell division septum initiation protein DivIVA